MRSSPFPRLILVLFVLLTTLALAAPASAAGGRPPRSVDYWALGDSVAAGTGLGDDAAGLGLTPCRRSWDRSYPQRVAAALRTQIADVQFPASQFLACSGARVSYDAQGAVDRCFQTYWFNQDCRNKSLHNQVDTVVARLQWNKQLRITRPTIVTITAGANDLDYTDPLTVYQAITWGDDWYNWYVQQRSEGVRLGLTAEIVRLMRYPNVTVVVTDIHNPFNTDSFLFHLPGSQCSVAPPPYAGAPSYDCYQRTETALHAVNRAIAIASAPGRTNNPVGMASIHDLFHGHEGPRVANGPAGVTQCGFAPPDAADSWVQYATDPASNTYPFRFDVAVQLLIPGAGQWSGDCVHPNDTGAQQYANAVTNTILQMVGR